MSDTFNREAALETISDLTKEAWGFRVRKDWSAMSDAELCKEYDYFLKDAEDAADEERLRQERAVRDFEKSVADAISVGAADRQTAIRWIVESLDLDDFDRMYGAGAVCHQLGLPFSMEKMFKGVV